MSRRFPIEIIVADRIFQACYSAMFLDLSLDAYQLLYDTYKGRCDLETRTLRTRCFDVVEEPLNAFFYGIADPPCGIDIGAVGVF